MPNDLQVVNQMTCLDVEESKLHLIGAWLPDLLHGHGIFNVDEDHLGQQANIDRLDNMPHKLKKTIHWFSCAHNISELEVDAGLREIVFSRANHTCIYFLRRPDG